MLKSLEVIVKLVRINLGDKSQKIWAVRHRALDITIYQCQRKIFT